MRSERKQAFALAHSSPLTPRLGKLILIAWAAGAAAVVVFGILSGSLVQAVAEWIALARGMLG
ncbi:hypothetical protein [Lysobacter enzymogenes]|uniref:hypothetical protein n=1 Tax=Lysobacter enzymogenes TaxID=69 RepID=UPI0009CD540B|nr:hypothetical protein [Lysobacter enzymogenes]UZW62413.1 hypothetical protein BV903_009030 [Lysobacter enzymogenes]